MEYFVEGTTCDMGRVERCYEGESALRDACIKAQNIEEDGGSATVTDEAGNEVDHWAGYRFGIDPASGTDQSVGLVFEAGLLVELNVTPQENQDGQGQDC
jgi:hypothetical protein